MDILKLGNLMSGFVF